MYRMRMRLKRFLEMSKITQSEFARKIGATRQAVWRWAHHFGVPRKATLRRIVRVTGGRVTYEDFVS